MTDPIPPEALDELDRLERLATPGPLRISDEREGQHGYYVVETHDRVVFEAYENVDCEFYAGMRHSARSIIDELREARRMLPKLDAEGHAYAKIADEMQAQRDAALAEVENWKTITGKLIRRLQVIEGIITGGSCDPDGACAAQEVAAALRESRL